MTVNTITSSVGYTGNGSQTNFPFGFKVVDEADIDVFIDGVPVTTGVTVNLNPDQETNPGGSVDVTPAPAVDADVTVARSTPKTQNVDYDAYDNFPAETHEGALDRLTLITQELQTFASTKATMVDPPASSSDTGTAGWIAYDSDYLYVCVATDTWKRVFLETW